MKKLLSLGFAVLAIIATQASAAEKDYMVVDLSKGAEADKYPVTYLDATPEGGWTDSYKTDKLVLRKIEPGTFIMGSPKDEPNRQPHNENQHQVTLTKPFYIGVFEVTQKQWELVMGDKPAKTPGDLHPVEQVSHEVAEGFLKKLGSKTEQAFVFPSEAQWEYACRAGTTTPINNGKETSVQDGTCENINEVAWYDKITGKKTHYPVGQKVPNAWGLYDMHGNVWEWCSDRYMKNLGTEAVTDPQNQTIEGETGFVFRGGSYQDHARRARSANRYGTIGYTPHSIGFRTSVALP